MSETVEIKVLKIAGIVEYLGPLAAQPMRGTLWGVGIDGKVIEREYVEIGVVKALQARIEELEKAQGEEVVP